MVNICWCILYGFKPLFLSLDGGRCQRSRADLLQIPPSSLNPRLHRHTVPSMHITSLSKQVSSGRHGCPKPPLGTRIKKKKAFTLITIDVPTSLEIAQFIVTNSRNRI